MGPRPRPEFGCLEAFNEADRQAAPCRHPDAVQLARHQRHPRQQSRLLGARPKHVIKRVLSDPGEFDIDMVRRRTHQRHARKECAVKARNHSRVA
jgi:hypothetical protein